MILNTGNRTDIPAFFSQWFINRIREGYVYSRNPYYPDLVTKYQLNPKLIDVMIFCTKNPQPLLPYLEELKEFRMYWHVTITPYGKEIEPHVPNKNRVMDALKTLSQQVGKQAVIWRYDPIFINEKYTLAYHVHIFEAMCQRLSRYVCTCVISFIDLYKKTVKNFPEVRELTKQEKIEIAQQFSMIAKKYGIQIRTCLEKDKFLETYGIKTKGCMTQEVLEEDLNISLKIPKISLSREGCQCLLGNDIGAYNTCGHGCLYCYANDDNQAVQQNRQQHDPHSPLLVGHIKETDIIKEAKQVSYLNLQMSIFDL